MEQLYKNIKNRRLELGLTQAELAKQCGYKDHTTINKIENGLVDISIGRLQQIARALKTTPLELVSYWIDENAE